MLNDEIDHFYKKVLEDQSLKFRLRLFLSLDFSNSTNYKQSSAPSMKANLGKQLNDTNSIDSAISPWIEPFSYFISQIDQEIDKAWRDVVLRIKEGMTTEEQESCNEKILLRPKYWKPIGDEVVYQVRLVHPLQLALCLYCWKIVTKKIREKIIDSRPLNVKSSAWLAGFPINNSEFVVGVTADDWHLLNQTMEEKALNKPISIVHHILPVLYRADRKFLEAFIESSFNEDKKQEFLKKYGGNEEEYKIFARKLEYKSIDFLGPQMDTGFRIASKSTPKKMMVSADIAYILSILISGEVTVKNQEEINYNDNVSDKTTIKFCEVIYNRLKNLLNKDQKNDKNDTLNPTNTGLGNIIKKIINEIINENLKLYYDGRTSLKGVRDGKPYPLFWINADDENAIDIAETKLIADNHVKHEKVSEFTFRFLAQNYLGYKKTHPSIKKLPSPNSFVGDEWLMVPFIQNFNMLHKRNLNTKKKEELININKKMHEKHQKRKNIIVMELSETHWKTLINSNTRFEKEVNIEAPKLQSHSKSFTE